MARRIVLAVLALVAVLLGVVAVPLGLITTNQDRQDFQDETVITARTVANIAEERLDDGKAEPQLGSIVRQLGRDGYRVSVYNAAGRPIVRTPAPLPLTAGDQAHARAAGRETVYPGDVCSSSPCRC